MNDLPASTLFQQANARPMSGEELEVLGKQAADLYTTGRRPLTEAVVEVVKHAGLSPEQVKRVVEFANTDAYLQEFKKEGSSHKVVEFEGGPANFSDVLKDLNDGGGGTVFDRGTLDYDQPPPEPVKLSSNRDRLGLGDEKLASAFDVKEALLPYTEPLRDALDLKDKLASAKEEVSFELSSLETVCLDVTSELYGSIKQAALEGIPLGQIVQAWGSVTTEPVFVKAAFSEVAPRLLREGVFPSRDSIGASIEKTAEQDVLVNPEHPLVKSFADYCETLSKLAFLRKTQEELTQGLDIITAFLKHAAFKQADGPIQAGTEGVIPKAWRGAKELSARAAGPAAQTAEAVAGKLLGSGAGGKAGKAVGWTVSHLPHIGAAMAAEEAYQRARYSPTVQTAKNVVLSRIPMTHPYIVRQYALQQGLGF